MENTTQTLGDFIAASREPRSIIIGPITGQPELCHEDDFEPLSASYGPLSVVGAIGMRGRECNTLRGLFAYEEPAFCIVEGCALTTEARWALLAEYRELTRPLAA